MSTIPIHVLSRVAIVNGDIKPTALFTYMRKHNVTYSCDSCAKVYQPKGALDSHNHRKHLQTELHYYPHMLPLGFSKGKKAEDSLPDRLGSLGKWVGCWIDMWAGAWSRGIVAVSLWTSCRLTSLAAAFT